MGFETEMCYNRRTMGRLEKILRSQQFTQFVVTLAVLILTGCTASTPTPTPVPATATPDEPTPPATLTPTPEPTPIVTVLELWLPEELDPYGEQNGSQVLRSQLAEFSDAYPNLQVDVVVKKAQGRGGVVDFMRAARDAAPAVLPDLVVLDASDLGTVAGSDLVQPLDGFLASSTADDRFSIASAMGSVDGQTAGAALGVDLQHLAYRPALFDSPPVTWTEVISAPASFLFPAGGFDGHVNDATLIQYLGAGGRLTDAEGNPSLDEDTMIDVLDFYSRCITSTVIAPTQVLTATHADQVWEQFKGGEGGMTTVRASRYWVEADDTMAPAPIPTRDGQTISIGRGWVLAMVTDVPVRQESAMLLIDWLTAPENSALWTQATGYLPPTRSALRLWDVSDEERTVLLGLLEAAVPPPRPLVMEGVGAPMQQALEAVLSGRSTPEEAAASALERLQR